MFLNYVFILLIYLINVTVNIAINATVNVSDTNFIDSENCNKYENKSYHKYQFDGNYHLHRLRSTKAAKLFLEGCSSLYTDTNNNNKNDDLQRTFPMDNPDKLMIFGIFSLHELSIILYFDNPYEGSVKQNYVNLTLGTNRNTIASISGTGSFDNGTSIHDLWKIPSMPYYIALKTNSGEVQVSELRTGGAANGTPFLKYTYSNTERPPKPQFFRIDHVGPIYAHYSCCESQCSRQIFHRISGCNKYSTRSANAKRRFDLAYYNKDMQEKTKNAFTFNGNFFIDRPENTPLAAKVRFYDFNRQGDFYDVVLTDTHSTIYHHLSSENTTFTETLPFRLEVNTPVTINVTITESGRVALTQPYETKPFLIYNSKQMKKDRVNVRALSMTKLYDDGIRYDFYYNCSDVLTYFNETSRLPLTKIITTIVKGLNETRYDLVQIFNQTFNMNEKYGKYYNEKFLEFDDIEFIDEMPVLAPPNKSSSYGYVKKALTGACSFLFVGILKFLSSLECVRNLVNDEDEEKVKKLQKNISKKLETEISKYFEEDDQFKFNFIY